MTLCDLASIYEKQLLCNYYFIFSDTHRRIYTLGANKHNFLHLTGIQRCQEFKNVKAKDFFGKCKLSDQDINSLSFNSKQDRKLVQLKTEAFYNCYAAIHNFKSIYISENSIICAVPFTYDNKEKIFSISFICEDNSIWVPVSIKVDKDLASSKEMDSKNLAQISRVAEIKKEVALAAMKKYDKGIMDVQEFISKKYSPIYKFD